MRRNSTLTTIISVFLICVVVLGAFSIFSSIKNKDDDGFDKVSPLFSRGALSSYGDYVETESSLYTKQGIYCDYMRVIKDFDVDFSYQVFYYDAYDVNCGKSEVLRKNTVLILPSEAEYARIVITPVFENGDSTELSLLDVLKYSSAITVEIKTVEANAAVEAATEAVTVDE